MKLLLIEDDASQQVLLASALEANGYRVDTASDGESGFDMLTNATYDLLILDIMLPGISGLDVIKKIRSLIPLFLHKRSIAGCYI